MGEERGMLGEDWVRKRGISGGKVCLERRKESGKVYGRPEPDNDCYVAESRWRAPRVNVALLSLASTFGSGPDASQEEGKRTNTKEVRPTPTVTKDPKPLTLAREAGTIRVAMTGRSFGVEGGVAQLPEGSSVRLPVTAAPEVSCRLFRAARKR